MKKIEFNLYKFSKKLFNNYLFINSIFYIHISFGFFLVSFLSFKFNFAYEKGALVWLIIFFPVFIAKIHKDLKKKDK